MPSYSSYKKFMTILDEEDKIVAWFTTKTGIHIPLREGQSKEEATKNFFENRDKTTARVTSENSWKDESRHFNNNIQKKDLQHMYHALMWSLPRTLKNEQNWEMDIPVMETPEELQNFGNDLKRRYEAGEFSDKYYSGAKEFFKTFNRDMNFYKGKSESLYEISERFKPKVGENIDSEGNTIKPEIKAKLEGTKAVDENGNPVVLYIGTRDPVKDNKFDFKHKREDSVSKQNAIFATTKKEVAETYKYEGGEVKKVYFNIQRPLVLDFDGGTFHSGGYEEFRVHPYGDTSNVKIIKRNSHWADADEAPLMNKLVRYAKQNGYDSVIAKNIADWGENQDEDFDKYRTAHVNNDDYVVFDPKQIIVDE